MDRHHRRVGFVVPAVLVLMAAAPRAFADGHGRIPSADILDGKETFQICAVCHRLDTSGISTTGPNLYGVVGRKVGKLPGFHYSPPLAKSQAVWTAKLLDAWLRDPQKVFPGNRMPFTGLKSAADRRDVIAYIQEVSGGGRPSGAHK